MARSGVKSWNLKSQDTVNMDSLCTKATLFRRQNAPESMSKVNDFPSLPFGGGLVHLHQHRRRQTKGDLLSRERGRNNTKGGMGKPKCENSETV